MLWLFTGSLVDQDKTAWRYEEVTSAGMAFWLQLLQDRYTRQTLSGGEVEVL